jgi:hypothetical protein
MLTPLAPFPATPPASLAETYEDPEGFFTLQYPLGWIPHRSGSEMQFWADAQGNAVMAVSLHIKALSAEALVDSICALLAGRTEGYQELGRSETTLGGYPAIQVEQAFRWADNSLRGLMVGGVRNRIGFLLLARAPEGDYADLETTFQSIVASLQVREFDEAPAYEQWLTYTGEHGVFHYLPDTYVAGSIEGIAAEHERAFRGIVDVLEVDYEDPIHLYLYPSPGSLYRATARNAGFAIGEGHEVHALWVSANEHQSPGHEMTHVITRWTLGEPSEALLAEGIAVCLDHSGRDHHATAADLLALGRLVPLGQALGADWFAHDPAVIYHQSGSFVCFLLAEYGIERFKALYPHTDIEAGLVELYGKDLALLEREWLQRLQEW